MLGLFYRYLNAGNKKIYTKIRGLSASALEEIKLLCFWFHNTAIQNNFIMIIMKVESLFGSSFLYLTYTVTAIIKKEMKSVRRRMSTLKADFRADLDIQKH